MNWADNILRDVRYKKFVPSAGDYIFVFHNKLSPTVGDIFENSFKTNLNGVLRFNVAVDDSSASTWRLSVLEDDVKMVADQTTTLKEADSYYRTESIYLDFPVKALHKYTVRWEYVKKGGIMVAYVADSIKGKIVDDLNRYIYREG